jgi:hypothetical protein
LNKILLLLKKKKEHTFKSDILFANTNILLGVILDHVLSKMTRKSANVNKLLKDIRTKVHVKLFY